jgi:hypothetical protein
MFPMSTTNYESLPSTPSIAVAVEGGAAGPTRERIGLEVGAADDGPAGIDKLPDEEGVTLVRYRRVSSLLSESNEFGAKVAEACKGVR